MRRSISLLITAAITSSMFSYAYAEGIEDKQNKLNEVNSSIQQKKDKLKSINGNKENVQKELESLDKDMSQASATLQTLNGKISDLNSKIKVNEKEIQSKKQEYLKENELFKQRVRALYKSGNSAYLDVILNSKDFSDLIGRMDIIKKIIDYDKNLISDIKEKQESLEKKQSELEKNKKSVLSLKSEADEKYKMLKSKSSEKKQLVEKLDKDKKYYENMIAQEQSESQELTKTIQQMKNSSSSTQINSNGKLFCVTGKPYAITSPFGMRYHPVLGYSRLHAGIDIGVPIGTPVYALKDGVVIAAQSMSGYGNVVMINHGGITSVYGHNSSLAVSPGQVVKGGQLISYSGNTGVSSGPHLHFEIRNSSGQPIEPSGYYVR